MKNVLSPSNLNKVVSYTDQINAIPNVWDLYEKLGIFKKKFLSQKVALVPKFTEITPIIVDRNWGARNNVQDKGKREVVPFAIPHFPLDDSITANDLDGQVAWDSLYDPANLETVNSIRLRKMEQMRRGYALAQEKARAQVIDAGTAYAPNGTVVTNYFTEFGVAQTTKNIALSAAADPKQYVEPIIKAIQNNLGNGTPAGKIVAICGQAFFAALVGQPYVLSAFTYWEQTQSAALLSGRLNASVYGLDDRYRTFSYGGILWVEDPSGYITDTEARAFPTNIPEMFATYYAPAERLSTINKPAQEIYWFEYLNEKDDLIEIMSESNFLNAVLYPAALVRVTKS